MDGGSAGTGAFFSNCLCWCQGVSVQARRVGAAWDVSCTLVLSRLPYLVLQCTRAETGGLTLTFSLCMCPGSCSQVAGSLRAHCHTGLSPCLCLTQRGEPPAICLCRPLSTSPSQVGRDPHTHPQSYRSGWQLVGEKKGKERRGSFPSTCEGSSLYMQMSSLEMQSTSLS